MEKLDKLIPEEKKEDVLNSFCRQKPKSFRVNTLKLSSQELEKRLQSQGLKIERVPWYTDAFILHEDSKKFMETQEYQEGMIYIQGLSSMLPAIILDPKPRETILDIAAAPGSKTTQIAMMMQNKGHILANDISRARLFRLKDSLQTQAVTNTEVTNMPGETLWKRYTEYFDKTLVDVPCSMEGRFEAYNKKSYEDWTPGKVRHLAPKQCFLLRSAISSTKVGGTIVYSTCTLSPEENEGVIDWILKKEGTNIKIEQIELKDIPYLPGITQWGVKKYNPAVSKTVRVLPSGIMEGFFVAKIRKVSSYSINF